MIEAGKTLEIELSMPDHAGLVEVTKDGRRYAMFADDLRERAAEIGSADGILLRCLSSPRLAFRYRASMRLPDRR
jgi:hypothetical protein